MKVTIAGGAITAVQDMRKPKSYALWRVYDVTDALYGATGDGTTNDRTAIQNCFNAARSTAPVYFPAATYFLGTHTGGPNVLDLSALGDNITIKTGGFVELLVTTGSTGSVPRIIYLSNNSNFYCDPIAFRDTAYDDAAASVTGAIAFYVQNTTPTTWGNLYFQRILAQDMLTAISFVSKTGVAPSATDRIRNVFIGEINCYHTYYGLNCQNDGDGIFVGRLNGYQCKRIYYVYGVQQHKVSIIDRNPQGSTGKCYVARQVGGLNTSDLEIQYASRDYDAGPSGSMVVMDHIDLLGGEIADIRVNVDVRDSVSSYYPVYFRNYDGSGGSVDPTTVANITRDIRLSGSCDANGLPVHVEATYSALRRMEFHQGFNFVPDQTIYNRFQFNQNARSQTPIWGADSVAPSLGNGTITYDVDIVDGIAHVSIYLAMGNTTTFGTGGWYFQPGSYICKATTIGTCLFRDAGTAFFTGVCRINVTSSSIYCFSNNNSNNVGPTVPFTWANTDELWLSIAFPISA
jgi:hypothetical protein